MVAALIRSRLHLFTDGFYYPNICKRAIKSSEFQSTPSAWRETCLQATPRPCQAFQSTPSAWRETCGIALMMPINKLFQSTPSAWRETIPRWELDTISRNFNPLPPHGGRHIIIGAFFRYRLISIHSLRMEGDLPASSLSVCIKISIHSLRMEGDREIIYDILDGENFNPLPPHGGRPHGPKASTSTTHISIHSLRMEGDRVSSLGGATVSVFQSTPSAWRETQLSSCPPETFRYYNPLPPHGGRHCTI